MSGLTEKPSTAPTPTEGFVIPPQENPVKFGAGAIRDLTTNLVATDLNGVFPKNYVYMVGDYNLIFHRMGSHGEQHGGFSVSDDMIVLTPEGEYKSGRVKHDAQDWTNSWKFSDTNLQPASDLDIVKYSPVLLGELFHQLFEELGEQTELDDVTQVVSALGKRKDLLEKATSISQASLREMGENLHVQPQDVEERAREKKKIEQEDELLRRSRAALTLFVDREQIGQAVKTAVSEGRAAKVEEAVLAIQQKGVADGIFKPDEFEDWENLRVRSYHSDRAWNMVIVGGRIQEAYAYYGKQEPNRTCSEHILEMAPDIAQQMILRGVIKNFPKLKLRYLPL